MVPHDRVDWSSAVQQAIDQLVTADQWEHDSLNPETIAQAALRYNSANAWLQVAAALQRHDEDLKRHDEDLKARTGDDSARG